MGLPMNLAYQKNHRGTEVLFIRKHENPVHKKKTQFIRKTQIIRKKVFLKSSIIRKNIVVQTFSKEKNNIFSGEKHRFSADKHSFS